MSRSQSFFRARDTSLPAVRPDVRATGFWWTGAFMPFACLLTLSVPASASPVDIGTDNINPCESVAGPAASKSVAILGGKMSALEAMQVSQRVDAEPACHVGRVASLESAGALSPEIVVTATGSETDFNSMAEAFAITANPSLLGQALSNLRGKHFQAQSQLFAGMAFAEFMVPVEPIFLLPEKPKINLIDRRFASANLSNSNLSTAKKSPVQAPEKLRVARTEPSAKAPFSGKPDIFGTIALKVSHTPLDRKWSGAQNGRESAIARAALVRAGAIVGADQKENNIRAVNRWVNANVRYVEDRKLYGQADHWASAGTTLKSGRGDCEDFAIAKMQLLQASGVKASDMFLVIAKDLVRRADHSLLVIRVGNEMLVLDNETDQILNAEDVRDYRPIMSYSANGKWLHGYPAKPSGTQMASLAVGR